MDFNTTTIPKLAEMEPSAYAGLLHTLQTVAIAALVFAACASVPKIAYRMQLAKFPAINTEGGPDKRRKSYLTSAKALYSEGYRKFKDTVFVINTCDGDDTIVIPMTLMPELRKLPDDFVSFPLAIYSSMEVKYTQLELDATVSIHAIKSDLTPALPRLNATIVSEVNAAMRRYLPSCEDWTEVSINRILLDVIAKVSGTVFVGPDLSSDPEYLDIATKYTVILIEAVRAIKRIRPILRPFLVPRLPEVKRMRDMEIRAAEHLEPIVRERLEAEKNDPNWKKPEDMMQWLLKRGAEHGDLSVKSLAKKQLGLIFAAMHTTTAATTNMLYTMAVTPEYLEPLREEIRDAMADNDGTITVRALQQMVKLDSYMKEVLRFYPPGHTTFGRRVLKGFTLSNGQYIPKGVLIEVPSWAIYNDSQFYPDAETFDGFRHYKLREGGSATDHARNQFVTTNETNLGFGYGRHACPGRFFAANEIKMILARMILDYDIKMPGDVKERHPNIEVERANIPNPSKTIMLKRVEV